jgi:nitrous oxidase accessory protein NosD
MLLATGTASAATLKVDNDNLDCPKADYQTISAALAAANPGDKVQVCAGTYPEQAHVTDDKLKLEGKGDPTIQAPPTYPSGKRAIVHIDQADDVTVRNFTVSGPWTEPGCFGGEEDPDSRHIGIYVDNSFDAKLTDNHVTLIRAALPAFWGCQDGNAIQVGRDLTGSSGSARIEHSLLDLYQKTGVLVDGANSTADIDHNEIVGDPGPAGVGMITAQNGIQISRQAGGQADHNEVRDNRYTGDPVTPGTGILMFDTASELRIDHNNVHDNDDGISLLNVDGSQIDHNESMNQQKYDGLYADADSAGNRFEHNEAFGNAEHDCHDDSTGTGTAGTANTWKGNKGATENKPGLCTKQ